MSAATRAKRRSKVEVVVLDDNDASTSRAKSVKRESEPASSTDAVASDKKIIELQQQVIDLQQRLFKSDNMYQRAVKAAATAETRVKFLEDLIDKKPAMAVDPKKVYDLEQNNNDLKKQLEKEREERRQANEKIDELTFEVAKYMEVLQQSQQLQQAPTIDASLSKKRKRIEETNEDGKKEQGQAKKIKKPKDEATEEEDVVMLEENEDDNEEGTSAENASEPNANKEVRVTNLAMVTTEKALENLFRERFDIVSAKISRISNGHSNMGIVQFRTRSEASRAIASMQGAELDGNTLELSKGRRKKSKTDGPIQLIVRKVPVQATPSEVESLFSAYNGFTSLHMPRNDDGSHRGFAFVTFTSKHKTGVAFSAIPRPTYLNGIKIIVEYARSSIEAVETERKLYADSLREASTNSSSD